MELMFLILGKTICSSLSAVIYLTTDPPTSQQKAIRPISLISENDDDPYWKNHIEKYFNHPEEEEFTNLTYPEYFKNYEITITQLTSTKFKFRHLKLHDEQLFFYQKLLLELPCKIEEELFGKFLTYQEHWLFHHPEFNETLQQVTHDYIHS
ncbi:hypothetical protein RclHR1_21620005 [Rhizophagus clarus]|uniref:Uncharacterized protein n=1 Tax=Rhizophagus clarus TaxID=94130 RepID=A0A2Z6QTD7_9GLOM|nr:hypothetical protein RclHR1_21620005 [Rhizophagus clarus]